MLATILILLGARGGLSDAEIDAIAAAPAWPSTSEPDKMRGYMIHRGTAPREAAAAVVAAFMAKHGLASTVEKGFDWYNEELAAGFVYGGAEGKRPAWQRVVRLQFVGWSAVVEIGREPDFTEKRRAALREIEAAAERLFLELARDASGKMDSKRPPEVAQAVALVRRAQQEAAARWYQYREALERYVAGDEDPKLAELRKSFEEARRAVAARREELRPRLTRREEARLILRGVLE